MASAFADAGPSDQCAAGCNLRPGRYRAARGDVELTDDDGGNAIPTHAWKKRRGHYTVEVSSLSNGAGMVEMRVQVDGASADGAAASASASRADAAAADDAAAVEAASR